MSYTSRQEMIDEFGMTELVQLTDIEDPPAGAINDVKLDKALGDADDVINGYLANLLPFASPPKILAQLARDIARYKLYKDRPTEEVRKRHDEAIRYLERAAAGKVKLGPDAQGTPTAGAGGPEHSAPDRVFTRDTLNDF